MEKPVRLLDPKLFAAPGQPLPPDHFLVPCGYTPMPPRLALQRILKGGVSEIFDGRLWRKHSSRVRTVERPGNRMMRLKQFGHEMDVEDALVWGLENECVPAMGHNEAIGFGVAHPQLQWKSPIAAFGSFAACGGTSRNFAVLRENDEPWLTHEPFDGRLPAGYAVLFVYM